MICAKAIQTCFTPSHSFLHEKAENLKKKRKLLISFCKSNSSSSDEETTPDQEGDSNKQELLVQIARIQTQKVRLTDYLDERSAYLTQFAEEANAEIDQIGENALRELDQASAEIMGNIDNRMQAFEEIMEMNKAEIEENEQKLVDFEEKIQDERNEGLFFKSFGMKKQVVDKALAKGETEKIRDLTAKSAGSLIRRNIYVVLIAVVVAALADSWISSVADWKKGVLVVVLIGLISQLVYEQSVASETDKVEKK